MIGLDTFADHFEEYSDQYIVIGGAACDDHFRDQGLEFRATKDIDMILVVEALADPFIAHFWEFVRQGKYEKNEVAVERQYYRFTNPETDDFPVQLELFSRTPDVITEREDMRFTPIPADEDISSLSAILMDENYYKFTLEHSVQNGILRRADDLALICLKARAFIDLSERKAEGQRVDSSDIKKHKNDVFRLAATLLGDKHINLPDGIHGDVQKFVDQMEQAQPETSQFLKAMGITGVDTEDLIGQLRETFKL